MKKFIIIIMSAILAFVGLSALAVGQTQYATGTNTARVVFGPNWNAQQTVTAVSASSDKSTSAIKFYTRAGAGKLYPFAAATNGAQTISVTNIANALNTNDTVVYAHTDGTMDYTTISSVTTNSITLAAGISESGVAGDAIYEVQQSGQMPLGTTAVNIAGYVAFVVPVDSPLVVSDDANTNATLMITIAP